MGDMTRSRLPVLVAYDGSVDAERALDWAIEEAARNALPVRVAIVDDDPTTWAGMVLGWNTASLPDVTALMGEVEVVLKERGVKDGSVERHDGSAVAVLLQLAESASVLVVGSRGHGAVGEVLTGSVSQHLTRHATCTVVVVRAPHTPDSGRIIVGVDGSPTSFGALTFACQRAEQTGEVVVAMHGFRVRTPSSSVWSSEPRSISEAMTEKELLLAESIAGFRNTHPDVKLVSEVIPVGPATLLVDASLDASLVVVGSRGLGPFGATLLGSVSHHVLHRAQCPVAIVR